MERLNHLVNRANSYTVKELLVLKKWLVDKRPSEFALVGVEYDFDDGARKQGRGDALLWHKDTLIVVECKRIYNDVSEGVREKRQAKVVSQARGYSKRLASWLRHLSEVGIVNHFELVLGATLIAEYHDKHAELTIVDSHYISHGLCPLATMNSSSFL